MDILDLAELAELVKDILLLRLLVDVGREDLRESEGVGRRRGRRRSAQPPDPRSDAAPRDPTLDGLDRPTCGGRRGCDVRGFGARGRPRAHDALWRRAEGNGPARTFRGVTDRFERAAAADLRVVAVLAIAMAAPFDLQAPGRHVDLDLRHAAPATGFSLIGQSLAEVPAAAAGLSRRRPAPARSARVSAGLS